MASAVNSGAEPSPGSAREDEPDFELGSSTVSLRESWQFSAVVQFCRLFGNALQIKSFSADQLERALVQPASSSVFLSELVYKLLRPAVAQPVTEKDVEGWHDLLQRKLSCNWTLNFESNPLQSTDFYSITPTTRAEILYALCEWRVHECPVVRDVMRTAAEGVDVAPGAIRHEPVGEDAQGNRYYYFSSNQEDCRLYREKPPPPHPGNRESDSEEEEEQGDDPQRGEAGWETVCTTLDELHHFVDRLSNSNNTYERSMHDFLATTVVPKLEETVAARRRADEKAALLEAAPSKRSNRLQEVQKRKDEEDRKQKEEEEKAAQEMEEVEAKRKEQERALRLQRRLEDEERRRLQALEEQRKISGLSAVQPSREERMQRRVGQPDEGTGSLQEGGSAATPSPSAGNFAAPESPRGRKRSHSEALSSPMHQAASMAATHNPGPGGPEDGESNPGHADIAPAAPESEPAEAMPIQQEQPAPGAKEEQGVGEEEGPAPVEQAAEGMKEKAGAEQPVPASVEPTSEQAAPASANRPVRSSRMVVPRKYQDQEDEEEEEAGPPAAKRAAVAKQQPPGSGPWHPSHAHASQPPQQLQPQPPPGQPLFPGQWGPQGNLAHHPGGVFPSHRQRQPPQVPQFRALYPSALDMPVQRRLRSRTPRRPRSSRASINRLKQAAHGTLPLGVKKAKASVYLLAGTGGSPEASASESEDLGEEDSSEYSDSDEDSNGPRRGGRRGKGRPSGGSGRHQQQQAGGYAQQQQQQRGGYAGAGGMQVAGLSLQQQQLLASASPQVRSALMQRMMLQQQAAVQAQAQAHQMAAAQQARGAAAGQPPPLFAQLSQEQQRAVAAQFLAQLPPQQQMVVRQLAQDQLMSLLQDYYQSKVLAGGGQGMAPPQQPPPQQMAAPQQQQQQFGIGGAPAQGGGPVSDQAKLGMLISSLAPEARAQLQAMPPEQQRAVLLQLLQRHQMAEQQQRMMQQQQGVGRAPPMMGVVAGTMQQQQQGGMMRGMGHAGVQQQPGAGGGIMQQQGLGMMRAQQQGFGGGRGGGDSDPLQDVNWFLNDS